MCDHVCVCPRPSFLDLVEGLHYISGIMYYTEITNNIPVSSCEAYLVVGNLCLSICPKVMVTHHPYLCMASVLSLFSVAVFYTVLWLRRPSASSSSSEMSNRVRRAARNRARRQQQQQQQTRDSNVSQPNGSIVRRRRKGDENEREVEEDTAQDSQGSSEEEEEEGHRHSS